MTKRLTYPDYKSYLKRGLWEGGSSKVVNKERSFNTYNKKMCGEDLTNSKVLLQTHNVYCANKYYNKAVDLKKEVDDDGVDGWKTADGKSSGTIKDNLVKAIQHNPNDVDAVYAYKQINSS